MQFQFPLRDFPGWGGFFPLSPKTWPNDAKLIELNATGHLAYLSEASTLHNSLLLHDDTDAVTFMFEPSMHTDRVQVMVEHPLLAASTWEDGFQISTWKHSEQRS